MHLSGEIMEPIKLKFVEQDYQTDAVNAIVDIFDGCEQKDSLFTITKSSLDTGFLDEYGYSNKLTISEEQILENMRVVQQRNNIVKDKGMEPAGMNFTIEMETGTGKTYVYTKTILELNKRYGWTKFIIVVPSVAIKEGVAKSFDITKEHFDLQYNHTPYDYFVYDSNKIARLKSFANSSSIQVMIMTIGAFNKSLAAQDTEAKANLIYRPSDKLDGWRGIDLIQETHPIVIIDEPQSVDNTKKAKDAIKALGPLFTLRYSATHKELYHLMYRLTPVDAYHQHLVKEIWVDEVLSDEQTTKPYVKLLGVSGDGSASTRAKLEIYRKTKDGSIAKETVQARTNDDLWDLSKEVEYYQGNGYIVEDINAMKGYENVLFSNGVVLNIGDATGVVNEEAIKRAQIRETISEHLKKERTYINQGIKVLSLIFIDKVENYRLEDGGKGKYAVWFEEEFNKLINSTYASLKQQHPSICYDAQKVHEGYFSKDKKGKLVDTKGDGENDDTTYNLIMKEKGKLLSLDTPIRFIFSHSALREGWDNPNVFQVCTLIETKDPFTKRQKIGRGLRICVNQSGDRVLDTKFNRLTVVANESYKDFCNTLQKEFADQGYKFGIIEVTAFVGLSVKDKNEQDKELTQEDSIKIHKILEGKGYIDKNKATAKFYQDKQNGDFETSDEYADFDKTIAMTIENLSKDCMPKNVKEKVKVNRNNKVINSEVFNEIWNRINQKTIYSINMPLDEMKADAIEAIHNMLAIKKERIASRTVSIDIGKEGVVAKDGGAVQKTVATFEEYETPNYPDFVRRLTDATHLLRGTIIEIVAKSGRINDFYNNPEMFIKQVSKIINNAKTKRYVEGIRYSKIDEFYKQEDVFDDAELYGIKDSNIVDVSAPDKNPFDHVIFDSEIEKAFAKACDEDEDVLLYAKLPAKFTVDTPYGTYNPDWMVVVRNDENECRLYFVAETKGNSDIEKLRQDEQVKIRCGMEHFAVLNQELEYRVIKTLQQLKENVYNIG